MLNSDLSGIDTSYPVLEAGIVTCVIAKCYQGVSKEKKTPGVFFELTTQHATKTTTQLTKPAGFLLRDTVWLTPSDTYDPRVRLAQIKEAVFGDKAGSFGDPAGYVGKPVTVRIKVEASAEFGNQNKVQAYVKLQS